VSTIAIVVAAVWNGLLLAVLAAVIGWRRQVFRWVTGLDRPTCNQWDTSDDEAWSAFLAEHPELSSGDCGEDSLLAADRQAGLRRRVFRGRGPRS
jgi:hypothetical protein